jgi:hypothetical protein
MPTVGSFLDFCDLATPAGELDVIADLKVSHLALPIRRSLFPRWSIRKDRRRFRR